MQALQGDAQGRIITAPQTSPGAQQARRGYGRDVVRGRLSTFYPIDPFMGPRCVQTSWISIPGSVGIAWRSIRKLVPRAPLQPRPATQRRDSAQSPPCARRQCLLLSLVELTTVPLVSSYLSLVCAYCVLRGADGFGRSCPQEQALTGFKILPYNEANGPEKVFSCAYLPGTAFLISTEPQCGSQRPYGRPTIQKVPQMSKHRSTGSGGGSASKPKRS